MKACTLLDLSRTGGFTPQGFTYESKQNIVYDFSSWVELLKPYQINFIKKGYSGVDIHPLIDQGLTFWL